jgi:hypothetical protein
MNEKEWALSILSNVDAENKHITVNEKADTRLAQQWDVVYADEWKGEPGKGELNEDFGLYIQRPFYIVSALPSHKYLDLINNRNMVIKTPNGRNTQTWWFDQITYTIKTKLNNQSWDIKSAGKTNDMQIWSTNSQWFQIFKYDGTHFQNVGKDLKILTVKESKDDEGQAVIVSNDSGKNELNQKWKVIYLDQASKVPTKGFNKEFGWHINRPFYMVSRLPFKRVIESIGANNMVIKRWAKGRMAQ